jgi:hypothetical protein
MRLYGALTKVEDQDDGTIKVYGVASTGARDEAGEIVLPEAMKAALPDYMKFGAIREMHGSSAAGTALNAEVDEEGRTLLCAHIVDPVAVSKVRLGVYKGFSIGGKVLARDPNDRSIITKIRLVENSLVDRPCNPDAVIDLWKAELEEAAEHLREPPPPGNAEVKTLAEEMARVAGKPGRRADFLVKAREALVKRAREAVAEPESAVSETVELQQQDKELHEPLTNSEEVELQSDLANAEVERPPEPAVEPIEKVGRRNSAEDQAHIQAAHDSAVKAGAKCHPANCFEPQAKAAEPEDLAKAERALTAVVEENQRLAKAFEAALPQIEALEKRLSEQAAEVERLKGTPLPPKTAGAALAKGLDAITKEADASGQSAGPSISPEALAKALDGLPEAQRGEILMRVALSQPRLMLQR